MHVGSEVDGQELSEITSRVERGAGHTHAASAGARSTDSARAGGDLFGFSGTVPRFDGGASLTPLTSHTPNGASKKPIALATWLLPGLIGLLTAATGSLLLVASDALGDLRFGRCVGVGGSKARTGAPSVDGGDGLLEGALTRRWCAGVWQSWSGSDLAPEHQLFASYAQGYCIYIAVSVILATLSASLVQLTKMARGSGIPEVKTMLGETGHDKDVSAFDATAPRKRTAVSCVVQRRARLRINSVKARRAASTKDVTMAELNLGG